MYHIPNNRINQLFTFILDIIFTGHNMTGLHTGLLVIVALYVRHIYQSSARQTQILEQNVKELKEKLDRLEKADGGKQICSVETNDTILKTDISRMRERIVTLQAEVERLERVIKAHQQEDREDKLCLIEGVKRIGKFLGQDQDRALEAGVHKDTTPSPRDGCPRTTEKAPIKSTLQDSCGNSNGK